MTDNQILMKAMSTDLQENKHTHYMKTQNQNDTTESDLVIIPMGAIHFERESYLTPRRSIKYCALNPPKPPSKNHHREPCEYKRVRREGNRTSPVSLPSLEMIETSQSTTLLSPLSLSFQLLPRIDRICRSPPY